MYLLLAYITMYNFMGYIFYNIFMCRPTKDNTSSSAANFSIEIPNNYESKIDVLKAQFTETYEYICDNLDEKLKQSYKNIANRMCQKICPKISVNKRKELKITFENLLNNPDPVNFEIFKSFVDYLTDKLTDGSDKNIEKIISDISQEQTMLKSFIDLIANSSISPEKINELKTNIDMLLESSVSSEHVDKSVQKKLKDYLHELQKQEENINDIKAKNHELEEIKSILQTFRANENEILNEALRKQEKIIEAMKNENNIRKIECQNLRTELKKKFNTDAINIIYKLLLDRMP